MPDNDLIEALEGLLAQARSGELEGIAAATLLSGSMVGMTIAGECWRAPTTTIGLLWQVQQALHEHSAAHSTTE